MLHANVGKKAGFFFAYTFVLKVRTATEIKVISGREKKMRGKYKRNGTGGRPTISTN